jgi:hypothetical protein
MKLFLKSLSRMCESSIAKYAYSYPSNLSGPTKKFAENCKNFADVIDKHAKQGTPYQQAVLKSVARHVRNQNLLLAQDVLNQVDVETKNIIPKSILDFVSRNS